MKIMAWQSNEAQLQPSLLGTNARGCAAAVFFPVDGYKLYQDFSCRASYRVNMYRQPRQQFLLTDLHYPALQYNIDGSTGSTT